MDAAINLKKGLDFLRQGRDAEAAARFLAVQRDSPGESVALMYLGEILRRTGQLETAEKVFSVVAARRPDDGMVFAYLSQIKRRLGKTEAGLNDLERAVALAPRARWMANLGYGREDNKPFYERDLAGLEEAVARKPDWGLAYICRGVARGHAREKELERNAADIARGMELDPRHRWALCWLGEAYRWEQRHAEAVASLTELEKAGLIDGQSLARRGESRLWAGTTARALADFDAAVALEPRDSAIRAWRGEARLWIGDYAGARDDCDAALALPAPALWAHGFRGGAFLLLGERAAARRDLDTALARDPVDAETLTFRGELNRLEGRADAARADLDRAISLRPFVTAYLNRALLTGSAADLETVEKLAPALMAAAKGDAGRALELSLGNRTVRPTFAARKGRAARLRPSGQLL